MSSMRCSKRLAIVIDNHVLGHKLFVATWWKKMQKRCGQVPQNLASGLAPRSCSHPGVQAMPIVQTRCHPDPHDLAIALH